MNDVDVTNRVPPGWIPVRVSGWLSEGHTLTEADLEACLAGLIRVLRPLHAQNQHYGVISPDHVFIDPQGTVQIAAGGPWSAGVRTESKDLHDTMPKGFAAFEQYVDDPAWPLGPWTDIYGMCALVRSLILKQVPPDAVQRMVLDTCDPLRDMDLPAYSRKWLGVIDRGMSLLPQLRFDSMDTFAEKLGLSLPSLAGLETAGAATIAVPAASAVAAAPTDAGVTQQREDMAGPVSAFAAAKADEARARKAPAWMMGLVAVVMIALGGWLLRGQADNTPVAMVTPTTDDQLIAAGEPELDAAAAGSKYAAAPEPVAEPNDIVPVTSGAELAVPAIDFSAYTAAQQALAIAEPESEGTDSEPDEADPELGKVDPVPDRADLEPGKVDSQTATATSTTRGEEAPSRAAANTRVQFSIKPWGEVFINGASRGVSPPLRSLSLPPGEYRVNVVNGNLPPYQRTLTVRAGESTVIEYRFGSDE